jgi:hypothetical protein
MQFNSAITSFEVTISVGRGPATAVIVDTGSRGLLVLNTDVNTQGLTPTSTNAQAIFGVVGTFTRTVIYDVYNVSVNFGNGIISAPIGVGVVHTYYSTTWVNNQPQPNHYFPVTDFTPILGIGPYGSAPDPLVYEWPLAHLPGPLGQGVLVNDFGGTANGGVLQFGPNPLTPVSTLIVDPTTSTTDLGLTFTIPGVSGPPYTYTEPATIDSGGIWGFIPSGLIPSYSTVGQYLPTGTVISVKNGQTVLENYTVPLDNMQSPQIKTSSHFNSGYIPFTQQPIYVSYDRVGQGTNTVIVGTMIFDKPFE